MAANTHFARLRQFMLLGMTDPPETIVYTYTNSISFFSLMENASEGASPLLLGYEKLAHLSEKQLLRLPS